ncbi:MAG: arginine--tRNA ligase [Candidatus Lernaella stagnicola]|nr:arginine--tRNA ligase [Candidatus Lernaella stagnicola]
MRIRQTLDQELNAALGEALGSPAPAIVREAKDPKFGDYQANGVMGAAKQAGLNPRELAARVVEAADLDEWCAPPEIAGPGFINLRLTDGFLGKRITAMACDEHLDVGAVEQPRTVVVDFSSPNVAKPLHVGHLRSTILGDALVRVLKFLGHNAIGDNHVGDWGTQFGMLIYGFRRWGDEQALQTDPTNELERVYKLANDAGKSDETVAQDARQELAKLQAGDEDNKALWDHFVAASRIEVDKVYARLGVAFDEWRGESAYHNNLGSLVNDLLAKGLAREDEGAVLIYFDEDADPQLGDKPFMIRKSDGAFNYATTDLATIAYRDQAHDADEIVYVVDKRQNLHFQQLFAAARALGYDQRFVHVGFGTILGPDGRPIKTREGGTVRLADLLSEAVTRAAAIIAEKNPDLSEAERRNVAEAVGVGAVKYADLSQNRNSDYRFDWDKLLAFEGNTAPYLQYVHARIRSIFRKYGAPDWRLPANTLVTIQHPAERGLALSVARFADVVHDVPDDYYPHLLTDHLFTLSQTFNVFYRDCPVLSSTGDTLISRLALCDVTARQLNLGLHLLGIDAPERM